jgi:hypothetical protein
VTCLKRREDCSLYLWYIVGNRLLKSNDVSSDAESVSRAQIAHVIQKSRPSSHRLGQKLNCRLESAKEKVVPLARLRRFPSVYGSLSA